MSYMQENLNEIIKFFHIERIEDSKIQGTYSSTLSTSYLIKIAKRNIFSEFLKINSFLINMVNNKLNEDLIID